MGRYKPAILEAANYDQPLAATWRHRQLESHAIYSSVHVEKYQSILAALKLMPVEEERRKV